MKNSFVALALLVFGLSGCVFVHEQISHRYDYQAQPPTYPYDTPASPPGPPPPAPPPPPPPTSRNPLIAILSNQSDMAVRVKIGDREEVKLLPFQPSPDIELPEGQYLLRVIYERRTNRGVLEYERFLGTLTIRRDNWGPTIVFIPQQ